MGYIDRELNKPSQTRSGIAQAALRRLRGGPVGAPRGDDMGLGGARGGRTDRDFNRGGGFSQGGFAVPGGRMSGPSGGIGQGLGSAMQGAQSRLKMSPIGKISAPQLPTAAQGATGLPFDPGAADAQEELLRQKAQFEDQYRTGLQGVERQFMNQQREVENERPDAERELLENYAGRGLAYSSGYTHDYGGLQGQYENLLAQLRAGKTDAVADLLRQREMFGDDYAAQLARIQKEAARRLAENAGDLGLAGPNPQDEASSLLDSLIGRQEQAPTPVSPLPTLLPGGPPTNAPQLPVMYPAPAPAPAPRVPAPTSSPFLPAPPRDNSQVPSDGRNAGGPIANRPTPPPPATIPGTNSVIPPALAAIIKGNTTRDRSYRPPSPAPTPVGGSRVRGTREQEIAKAAARMAARRAGRR